MTIKSLITDPKTGIQASVVDGGEENAVVVATRELKSYTNKIKFFSNPQHGYSMNIAVEFGGRLSLFIMGLIMFIGQLLMFLDFGILITQIRRILVLRVLMLLKHIIITLLKLQKALS